MKKLFPGIFLLLIITELSGQDFQSDSLKALIAHPTSDSAKAKAMLELGRYYFFKLDKDDKAVIIFRSALSFAREKAFRKEECISLRNLAFLYSDNHKTDSSHILMQEALDLSRAYKLVEQELFTLRIYIGTENGFFIKDSFFTFYDRMLLLCRENKKDSLPVMATFAESATDIGNYPRSLQTSFSLMHINEEKKDSTGIQGNLYQIGLTYEATKDFTRALECLRKAKTYGRGNSFKDIFVHVDLSKTYLSLQQNDSATLYAEKAYQIAVKFYKGEDKVYGGVLNDLGTVYTRLGMDSLAIDYLRRSYVYFTTKSNQYQNYCASTIGLANYFRKKEVGDSCLFYARLCLATAIDKGLLPVISESSEIILDYFQHKNDIDSAYYYQKIGFDAYKTLYNDENGRQLQNMASAELQRENDIEKAKKQSDDEYADKLRLRGMMTIGIALLTIGIIVYHNNRRRRESYELLKNQKQEIDLQKSKLETSLGELQSTQSQLIQSEKMASLGELTAGIAHEIQNPLNFVNNFSEINQEMIDELQTELHAGNIHEAISISNDIRDNEVKIIHHGKRADAIVKGMLQHSRQSSGANEPTDINALTDEYLRLSYHGLRTKDKLFNAILNNNYDNSIGNINIIPQDIGRVLLNLFNNAFYAVAEKQKTADYNYQPTVSISTKKSGDTIELTVSDNGNGIPQAIKEKIFQPFFTTKPTGQGTGLGLSLSYDIVKAHGGELSVEATDGQGSVFTILLPL